jgi:hypothetical protein
MHKLTYASQTTPAISDGDLEMILKAGRRNNTKSALTGLLLYCAQSCLRILQCALKPLTATYERAP